MHLFLYAKILNREFNVETLRLLPVAAIAQLGERQTEDLKVPGSIPGGGIFFQF